jgi:hypothetical protein
MQTQTQAMQPPHDEMTRTLIIFIVTPTTLIQTLTYIMIMKSNKKSHHKSNLRTVLNIVPTQELPFSGDRHVILFAQLLCRRHLDLGWQLRIRAS